MSKNRRAKRLNTLKNRGLSERERKPVYIIVAYVCVKGLSQSRTKHVTNEAQKLLADSNKTVPKQTFIIPVESETRLEILNPTFFTTKTQREELNKTVNALKQAEHALEYWKKITN